MDVLVNIIVLGYDPLVANILMASIYYLVLPIPVGELRSMYVLSVLGFINS